MYREILAPVDNSQHSEWAVARALELCANSGGRVTGNHVYAARLHDVRFRQLETGLPAQLQTKDEIEHQRRVHDKLIEKGLQLISDSFLDQVEKRCIELGVPLRRQLLEGINFDEIVKEANRGTGRLPGLIGFDPDAAEKCDFGARGNIEVGHGGQIISENEAQSYTPTGSSGCRYDLVVMGAHGIGRQPYSQLGGVVARAARGIEKDMLIVRDDTTLRGGKFMVCVDGSSYCYKAMRTASELARGYDATLHICAAFDVEFHHVVFNNIKDVLSVKASKVFKFEEQEELHNTIIDKGLLKLSQANIKRAEVLTKEFPEVHLETQILIGKPFQVILQWAEEIKPSLLIIGRHGAHRIEGTQMGSQADNLLRLAPCNVLVTGTVGIKPEDIPSIEEDGQQSLPWTPDAEIRIQRVPPFAQGIARRAVEEFTAEQGADLVTREWLEVAIEKLLPTHMQLLMGLGDAEELARAEVRAEEQMAKTLVLDGEDDAAMMVEAKCPVTGHGTTRERTVADLPAWTVDAFERLNAVPLIARPLARSTVEKFARSHGMWRITTTVMDENKQAMIAADEFDADTMLGMFRGLRAKQIRAQTEGGDHALTQEIRQFIEEAKATGVTRCPIRDIEESAGKCPVDFKTMSAAEAKAAVEQFMNREAKD